MFLDGTKSSKYYVSVGAIDGNPKLPKADTKDTSLRCAHTDLSTHVRAT